MSDSQVVAAASTFSKRYAFCNAFGILTGDEDNDGQAIKTPAKDITMSGENQFEAPEAECHKCGNPITKAEAEYSKKCLKSKSAGLASKKGKIYDRTLQQKNKNRF